MKTDDSLDNVGFPNVGLSKAFFRMLIGFFSGLVGTMILGIILFVAWGAVGDSIQEVRFYGTDNLNPAKEDTQVHPLFLNFITLAIFLSSLAATICYGAMISQSEGRQEQLSTTLTHIFVGNLVILVLILPLYFATSGMETQTGIILSTIIHSIMACLYTYMIMEVVQETRYISVHLFGVIFGIILFSWIATFTMQNLSIFVFLTLPLLLMMIACGSTFAQMIYNWIRRVYGEDFLSIEKRYGNDYRTKQDDALSLEDI